MPTHIQIGDVAPRVHLVAAANQTVFEYQFPVFTADDIDVYLDSTKQTTGYTVNLASEGVLGNVTFDTAPAENTVVTLTRRIAIQRTSDFQESGEFRSKVINDELDYQTAALQQVADDQSRSPQMPITYNDVIDMTLPLPVSDQALVWNSAANGFVNGPTVNEISNAQGYAQSASDSAQASATSASSASGSAAAAATSASQAATAVQSALYSRNEQKSANFTVLPTDDGKQFLVDTSGGPVTVTLPEGSTATDGFRVVLTKVTADSNALNVIRSGTDTINGEASWSFMVDGGQSVVSLDTDVTPNAWFASNAGPAAPFGIGDLQNDAKPYDIPFVAGYDSTMMAEDVAVQTYGKVVLVRSITFEGVEAHAETGPVGKDLLFDVELNGTSIFGTKPMIVNGNNREYGSHTFTTATAGAGNTLTFKVTETGTTTPGAGITFTLKARYS